MADVDQVAGMDDVHLRGIWRGEAVRSATRCQQTSSLRRFIPFPPPNSLETTANPPKMQAVTNAVQDYMGPAPSECRIFRSSFLCHSRDAADTVSDD